jgi:hypothetical protein
MKLVMTEDGDRRIKVMVPETGEELWLEEWLNSVFYFPTDDELDAQISSLRSGDEDAVVIERDMGPIDISLYKSSL